MPLSPNARILRSRKGGYTRAAMYDGREVTKNARTAFKESFAQQVDPDGVLPPAERARRAEAARRAYYSGIALKSAIARSKRATKEL
jgi:hypothetical protein